MKIKWIPIMLYAVCLLAGLSLAPNGFAGSGMTLSFVYNPSTNATTLTYSGSWGTYAQAGTSIGTGFSLISNGLTMIGSSPYGYDTAAGGVDGPDPWISVGYSGEADVHSGDDFGFTPTYLYASSSYTAGESISGSATWNNKTLADLSLTDGASGTLGTGLDTVSYTVSTAAVPEPATDALLFGLAALGFICFRHRRKARQG